MQSRFVRLLAAAALAAPSVTAQGDVTAIPSVFDDANGTFAIAAPLGRTRMFLQQWNRGDQLGRRVLITSIGWRMHPNTTTLPATTHKMEVTLASTPATFQLSTTFALNLGTSRVFLKMTNVSFPAQTGLPPDRKTPTLWIRGDAPFLYQGPHFLWQVDLQTATTWANNGYNIDGYSMSATSSHLHTQASASCGGSLVAGYTGTHYTLTLSGATPSTPAFLAIGALLFPLDVGAVIGPSCKWSVEPLVLVPVQANASGIAILSAPWTISTVDSLVLHAQGLHFGPSGLASTNAVHSALGGAGLSMYVYNYTQDGPVAQNGPYTSNRGPILLVR